MTYRIKPLVWKQYDGYQRAETPLGRYLLTEEMWTPPYGDSIHGLSIASGKLAAEAHYVERLTGENGCLELVEQEGEK